MQVMQVMQVIWTARRQPPGESQAFGLKGPRLQAPAILYAQARASKERAQATIVKPSLPWGGEPRPAEGPELRRSPRMTRFCSVRVTHSKITVYSAQERQYCSGKGSRGATGFGMVGDRK